MDNLNENYRRGFHEGMKMFGENMHTSMTPKMGGPAMSTTPMMGGPAGNMKPTAMGFGGETPGGTQGGETPPPGPYDYQIQYLLSFYGQSVPPAPAWLDFDGDGVIGGADLGLFLAGVTPPPMM